MIVFNFWSIGFLFFFRFRTYNHFRRICIITVRHIVSKLLLHRLLVWTFIVFLRYLYFLYYTESLDLLFFSVGVVAERLFLNTLHFFHMSFLFDWVACLQHPNLQYTIAPKFCWPHTLHPTNGQYPPHRHHSYSGGISCSFFFFL